MSERGMCLTCEFFDQQADGIDEPDKGCCRRYPPTAAYYPESDECLTVWPAVDMSDRRGEWRPA